MRRTILSIVLAGCALMSAAQIELKGGEFDLKYVAVSDPEYLWTQYEEKDEKVVLDRNVLRLESKQDGLSVISCAEFMFNPEEEDFIFEFVFKPSEVNDKKPFGIVFDYKNESNYSLITFSKKGYMYSVCEKGELSVVKRGMYKLAPRKKQFGEEEYAAELQSILKDKNVYDITLVQQQGKLILHVNDVEVVSMKNIKITNPNMGFYIGSKMKLDAYCVLYSSILYANEEEGSMVAEDE